MKKIKLFTTIIISIQLFIFIVLWFLSYDNVYKLAHTINSIFVLITGVLMIKYIIKTNKKVISEESISKTLLNLSLDGIYIENERGEILECNQSGHEIFGYTKKEMLNLTIRDLVPKEFAEEIPKVIPDNMATGDLYLERINMKKNGELFPTEINSKYIYINGKKRLIVFVRDISVRKQMEDDLREMSIKDELTKTYNRRYIMKKLKDEFFFSKINKSTFSIALLDIDNFKGVNDNFGHLFGDEVLIKFSNTIQKNLRKNDYLGRIGGEEFIIIFCNTFLIESYEVLFRIKEKLSLISWGENDFSITFSAGLFEVPHKNIDEHSSEKTIKLIDDLMYKAKECGKDCIITPSSENL
ncbi:sensor domain-containing diguanylate cyclase [Psychrilyobacter atlanticus]|uniref:sensor domain-containing diguanylate cyclase n=1 Tax=Psychrilyobacter atlanticus TaxID=271091 RepID=UPI000A050BB2|nr:sensor domain-containing diguanylate cyclase [Psychrilyobacter atlanticus]